MKNLLKIILSLFLITGITKSSEQETANNQHRIAMKSVPYMSIDGLCYVHKNMLLKKNRSREEEELSQRIFVFMLLTKLNGFSFFSLSWEQWKSYKAVPVEELIKYNPTTSDLS